MKGWSRALSRCAAALAVAALAAVLPSLRTSALATSTLACAHLHAAYSYDPAVFTSSVAVTVSGSTCTTGGLATTTSGSGSVLLHETGGALVGLAWLNHYDLSLSVGGVPVQTSFDADLVPYAVPVGPTGSLQGVFDHGASGTLQFQGGIGSGVLSERCIFDGSLTTCFDDAVLVEQQSG